MIRNVDNVDYRDLLTRYMASVKACEGVLPGLHATDEGYFKTGFTPAERDELRRLAEEALGVTLPTPTDDDYE